MAQNRSVSKMAERLETLEGQVRHLQGVLLPRQRLGLTVSRLRGKARKMSEAVRDRTAAGLVRQVRAERRSRASR